VLDTNEASIKPLHLGLHLTIQDEGAYRANLGQSQAAKYKKLKHPISRFKITDDRPPSWRDRRRKQSRRGTEYSFGVNLGLKNQGRAEYLAACARDDMKRLFEIMRERLGR
jgi:hypothetical protein